MFFTSRHILPCCICIGSLLLTSPVAVLHAVAEVPEGQTPDRLDLAADPAASDAQGWQSIDSGTRPAYAGIQGGTAPLTILRSSNGLLFAFTGQTGNDFTQVLRGNSANASSASPADQVKQAPMAKQDTGMEEATLPPEQEEMLARVASEAHTKQRTVASPPQQASHAGTDVQHKGNTKASEQRTETAGKTPAADLDALSPDPVQERTSTSSGLLLPPAGDLSKGNSLVETLSMPIAGVPVLIFASGDLASEIYVSEAVVPFGLPLPGERMGTPPPPLPEVPPLKLGDYRNILYGKGSL